MADDDRDESPQERADRNWNELLQELRVSQTGVQVLAGVVRAAGGGVPPAAARLLDVTAPVRTTSAVDADRTWLRALAELDPR